MQHEQWYCHRPPMMAEYLGWVVIGRRPLCHYMILYIRNENLLAGCVADGADFSCEFKCNVFLLIFLTSFHKLILDIRTRLRKVASFGIQKSNWLLGELLIIVPSNDQFEVFLSTGK